MLKVTVIQNKRPKPGLINSMAVRYIVNIG